MISHLSQFLSRLLPAAKQRLRDLVKPDNYALAANVMADLTRSKTELILENAFLRQQLIILDRQVKRPLARPRERVLLASRLRAWKQALLIVQPATVVRLAPRSLPLAVETQVRAAEAGGQATVVEKAGRPHPADGAGEPNLGRGADTRRAVETGDPGGEEHDPEYIRLVRKPTSPDQTWLTFLHNHASQVWACDFLQTYDLVFRALFVFVIIELDLRRVVHFAVTRHPTDAWVAQQRGRPRRLG